VTFSDQSTDGESVVIAEVTTDENGRIDIIDDARGENTRFGNTEVMAGTTTDLTVEFDENLAESQTLRALLIIENEVVARDEAYVIVGSDSVAAGMDVTFLDADPDAGFNYPYYLFAPSISGNDDDRGPPILVHPNNTGTSTDEFEEHRRDAERTIRRGTTRRLADELRVPMLVPVFPRPRSDPVDGNHYTHQLDRETLQIDSGPLERIDLQLLRMVEDAQRRLANQSYPVRDEIIMDGFSASGNLVDRFTVLHPDRVLSVTAGGLNGMALLPLTEANGHTLNYHVGIADVEDLTGDAVALDVLDDVNQFLYMGGRDGNDTIPFSDAWTSDELRQVALDVYGEDMVEERFPFSQSAYEQAGIDAQFRVYDGAGHTPRPAFEDLVEFHKRSIEGEVVDNFGQELGLVADVEFTPHEPELGESIEFDATTTQAGRADIQAYTWEFGDSRTAVGPTVDHAFTTNGEYTVTLTVVDSFGRTDSVETAITVGEGSGSTDTYDQSESSAETEHTTNTPGDTTAGNGQMSAREGTNDRGISNDTILGFGAGVVVTGIAGAGVRLAHRFSTDRDES
jgi:hypothetical protein